MRTEPSVRYITYVLSFLREVVRVAPGLLMPVSVPAITSENRLLAALPLDEYQRLLPQLADISFALGEVVYEFGGQRHDRLNTDELIMTQELIAGMLGVRREGVTVAAGRLQDDGLLVTSAAVSRSSIV